MEALNTNTEIKFKTAMHGILKDQVVVYGSCDDDLKLNIRRRLADKKSGLEIVNKQGEVKAVVAKDEAVQQSESEVGKDSKTKKRR